MRVLSLFDGIACGYEALQRAGIKVDAYYASEIDKYAIQIATKNHPDIIEIGDVTKVRYSTPDFDNGGEYLCNESGIVGKGPIDLLIGGSPCQGFSIAGKQLNFNDPRSALFFEYVRLLNEIKPKYFLLENVKMKREFADKISEMLGCQPIEINSSLVSAQSRKRLYWTNIPGITQPKDKGILLKDILEDNVDIKYELTDKQKSLIEWKQPSQGIEKRIGGMYGQTTRWGVYDTEGKSPTITASMGMGGGHVPMIPIKLGYIKKDSQGQRVYSPEGKSVSLKALGGGWGAKMGLYKDDERIRKLTPIECERLQTLPDNYTAGISDSQRYKALGNGRTVDVIAHIFTFINQ